VLIAVPDQRTIRVWLDIDRLQAYSLSPIDVANAFRREHITLPPASSAAVAASG